MPDIGKDLAVGDFRTHLAKGLGLAVFVFRVDLKIISQELKKSPLLSLDEPEGYAKGLVLKPSHRLKVVFIDIGRGFDWSHGELDEFGSFLGGLILAREAYDYADVGAYWQGLGPVDLVGRTIEYCAEVRGIHVLSP